MCWKSLVMGSNQSIVQKEAVAVAVSVEGGVKNPSDGGPSTASTRNDERSRSSKRTNMTGFQLVQRKCRKKKRAYDKCYAQWYGGAFVSGKLEETREDCDDLFDAYKRCIFMGIREDRNRRGVGPPKPGSALAEFAEEESEE